MQVSGLPFNAGPDVWGSSSINVSDASPSVLPAITAPDAVASPVVTSNVGNFTNIVTAFTESGSTEGIFGVIETQEALNAPGILHAGDPNPVIIYANGGSISGVTLYSPKVTQVIAGQDITDVALYIQNTSASDVSVVSAGRDITLYDPNSVLRQEAQQPGTTTQASNQLLAGFQANVSVPASGSPTAGDIQISGPGALEVLAGGNLDLGDGPNNPDGTGVGITSIGNGRNPFLPFAGASVIAAAGLGAPGSLATNPDINIGTFITQFVNGNTSGASSYLSELGLGTVSIDSLPAEQRAIIALDVFYLILRDAGRAHTAGTGGYSTGTEAISKLFGTTTGMGDITTQDRSIVTASGGDVDLAAPGGGLTLQTNSRTPTLAPPGIITQDGGNINIFTNTDVNLGISRIFTLRGGNIIIWSSNGSIAAGNAPKTVQSAPPTRVLVNPQSANVETDLAGLATGGGIGVLATVAGVPPGNVDLIAPNGVVDAGDAGIRATGNLNIAATAVLNASNIQVSGTSSGTPVAAVVAAPNIGGLTAGNATTASTAQTANDLTKSQGPSATPAPESDSAISVEVVGYGGGDGSSDSPSGPATGQ
jgi:hypothetical protein